MSNVPPQPGQPQAYYDQPPPTNALGIAGFVVSLSGMVVTFGLICPIGLVLSLIGLLKSPRGYAIAGSIIGVLGSILGTLTVLVMAGVIETGLFASSSSYYSPTLMAQDNASSLIDTHFTNNQDTLPDEPTGNALITGYTDEWNNNLKYIPTQGSTTDYAISSAGEDGLFGTLDDITQNYTAYSWTAPAATNTPENEIDEDDINAAFNLAAQKIVDSFPPGTELPTETQLDLVVGDLTDPWLMPLKYSPTDNPPIYHLKSAGPDKQWGTDDDLTQSFYFSPTGESDGLQ